MNTRKAKLKPILEQKGDPEGQELEQEQRPSGGEMRDGECDQWERQYTIYMRRYANILTVESPSRNIQLWQLTSLHPDKSYKQHDQNRGLRAYI
jgi:hypothetical protein